MPKKILKKTKKYYSAKDHETVAALVAKKLILKNKTISIAESCTGGLLSKRLTDIPGSSKYIKLNIIAYSNEAKNKLLSVPDKLLKKYGAVSQQAAYYMAVGIKKLAKTEIGFSITGIAGPNGGTKDKPVGLVYFGLAKGKKIKVRKMLFKSNSTRNKIRWLATQYALNWIRNELR